MRDGNKTERTNFQHKIWRQTDVIFVLSNDRKFLSNDRKFLKRLSATIYGNFSSSFLHFNPLNADLNPICYLLALLAHHFLHVNRIRVKSLPPRLLMSYIYGAHILDVSRSHTTTNHSRYDSSGRVISSSQRPLPDNTRHSQQTNIHAPGGIRTHDLSR